MKNEDNNAECILKDLQGKSLEEVFSKEQLEELYKDYYVNVNFGILSLGCKKIHISKME